jgi:hypothetical protein
MIVRTAETTLQLITQPDHAQLARRVMERSVPLLTRARRDSILHAIGEHDNGWAEEDAAPLIDGATGEILDFIHAPIAMRQRVWPRAVSRVGDDAWAAALIAQHALTAYDRFRPDADWADFFDRMTAMRDDLVGASGGALTNLLEDYLFVRLGDLISLSFCLGWSGDQQFADYRIGSSGDGRVLVSPDLFDGAVVPMEVAGREIPKRTFGSGDELHQAIATAAPTMFRGEVRGG